MMGKMRMRRMSRCGRCYWMLIWGGTFEALNGWEFAKTRQLGRIGVEVKRIMFSKYVENSSIFPRVEPDWSFFCGP